MSKRVIPTTGSTKSYRPFNVCIKVLACDRRCGPRPHKGGWLEGGTDIQCLVRFYVMSQINQTLSAVVDGCFNKKDVHSVGFVVRWLEEHCHRIIFPVHR